MASWTRLLWWLVPILAALYYWQVFASRRICTSDAVLQGKTVIVTGGNAGIGRETALDLARRGARVILACRNLQKAEDAAKEIKTRTGNSEVVVRHLDLGSLQSVREFSTKIIETEERLDILINNAGVGGMTPSGVSTTEDNFEYIFGINHFGHFLLTNLLLDLLRKSAPSRVVTVSSKMYIVSPVLNLTREDPDVAEFLYPHLAGYTRSKLANILFGRELARREASNGVISVSLHPGTIYTSMFKTMLTSQDSPVWNVLHSVLSPFVWLLFIDATAGAQTTLHCALDESVADLSGRYFDDCQEVALLPFAQDDEPAMKLWDASCEATGLKC